MLKVDLYSAKGTKTGLFTLPKDLEAEPNLKLLAQAIRVYEERDHIGLPKTKTRAEVNKTKKKWYRQKGTGGARHGAKSAPIFVGGGVAHGPKGVKRELLLPQNMRKKAFNIAVTLKAKSGEIAVIGGIDKLGKAKEASSLLGKLAKDGKSKNFTVVLGKESEGASKSFRNLENVQIVAANDLNAYEIFRGGILVLDKRMFEKPKVKK